MKLKVLILSRVAGAYSTQRLKEACERRGHSARILNTLNFSLLLEPGRPWLFYRDRPLSLYDAAIPRVGASVSAHGTAVVRQLEQMGVFTLNSARAIAASRDKLRALQVLSGYGLPFPPTALVRDRESVESAIEQVGGPPVIIKLIEGSQGAGVILADSRKAAEAVLETLLMARQNVVVQKFVSESRGRDLRALVVGDRVVAAMRRRAAPEEFRSNVHRGGRTEAASLEPSLQRMAVEATQILGLRIAGVDLIESATGPLLLEVNSSPGLEGIESATGVDVAGAIIEHMEEQLPFSDARAADPATASNSHGVVELPVAIDSIFHGRRLSELKLHERDVRVLAILRGREVTSNPDYDRLLAAGDRVLCFGPHQALRELLGGKEVEGRSAYTDSADADPAATAAEPENLASWPRFP